MPKDPPASEKPSKSPTTVRLDDEQISELDELARTSRTNRNILISLGVDALLDFARRTGKLPLPVAKKRNHSANGRVAKG